MPYALLAAYRRSLAKLEAEETLRQGMVTAYGSGNLKEEDARKYADTLREAAGLKAPRQRVTNAELRKLFGGI